MPGPSGFISALARPGTEPSNDKKSVSKIRGGIFPYDRPTSYGAPRSIDTSGGAYNDVSLVNHGYTLIPQDTENTPWDDETGDLEEASWYPVLFGKSSTGPSSGGFGTIPGTAGGWAGSQRDTDMEPELKKRFQRQTESSWKQLGSMLGISNDEADEILDHPPMTVSVFFLGDETSTDEDGCGCEDTYQGEG